MNVWVRKSERRTFIALIGCHPRFMFRPGDTVISVPAFSNALGALVLCGFQRLVLLFQLRNFTVPQ